MAALPIGAALVGAMVAAIVGAILATTGPTVGVIDVVRWARTRRLMTSFGTLGAWNSPATSSSSSLVPSASAASSLKKLAFLSCFSLARALLVNISVARSISSVPIVAGN
jgi:hypothetical protein